jgi:hypothetical protein
MRRRTVPRVDLGLIGSARFAGARCKLLGYRVRDDGNDEHVGGVRTCDAWALRQNSLSLGNETSTFSTAVSLAELLKSLHAQQALHP